MFQLKTLSRSQADELQDKLLYRQAPNFLPTLEQLVECAQATSADYFGHNRDMKRKVINRCQILATELGYCDDARFMDRYRPETNSLENLKCLS